MKFIMCLLSDFSYPYRFRMVSTISRLQSSILACFFIASRNQTGPPCLTCRASMEGKAIAPGNLGKRKLEFSSQKWHEMA